jgi:lysyl-tRNA synthetase class 2
MSKSFSHWQKFSDSTELKKKYETRMKVLSLVREFFTREGFSEVETPLLVKQPGLEPNLVPFESDLINRPGEKKKRFLITSPEHQMKMLLCADPKNIFQICKCFRNSEEGSKLHNPEFTMLEWYRVDANYLDVMKDSENLVRFIVESLFGETSFIYQSEKIDAGKEWERISVQEAFEKYANIDVIGTDIDLDEFFKIFITHIEPKLGRGAPTILYDYPAHMAAQKRGDVCERFEIYHAGTELANAFT